MKVVMRVKQRGFWNFIIPAVAAVAGSVLNKKSSDRAAAENRSIDEQNIIAQQEMNEANLKNAREMNEANLAAQREFAQHGIRWKVEDSKAAGLHPLFGAGLSGSTFSPSFQVSQGTPALSRREARADDYSWLAQVGQLLGNFLNQPEARPAQVQAAQQAAGGSQSVTITEHPGGGRTMVMPIEGLESQVSGRPLVAENFQWDDGSFRWSPQGRQLTDPRAKSHVSNVEDAAFWQRFSFGPKFSVILPKTSEPQEVFEDKPLWFWAMVAKANVKEYGPGWLTQARQQFPSLREVWDGVVQELRSSGVLDTVSGAVPSIFKR